MARYLLGCGSAADGQLGATTVDCLTPRPLPGFPTDPPLSFAAGPLASLVLTPHAALTSRPPSPPSSATPSAPIPLPAADPPLQSIVSVAAGQNYALLLSASGALYSCGTGAFGELGLRAVREAPTPVAVDALASVRVVAVAAAEFHWLCVDAQGAVFACGNNAHGQLGLAHTDPVAVPKRVTALWPHPIVAVATGDAHSAALSATGHAFCFGSNKNGQLGTAQFRVQVASMLPSVVPIPQPPQETMAVDADVANKIAEHAISSGDGDSNLRVKSAMNKARSSAKANQLAKATLTVSNTSSDPDAMDIDTYPPPFDPSNPTRNVPASDDPTAHAAATYIDIACGSAHTVALRSDGAIVCWGSGDNGQLGSRARRSLYQPTVAHAPAHFVAVAAGQRHSGAVNADGVAYLWGDGTSGQLGDGDASEKFVPIALPPPRVQGNPLGSLRYARLQCGGYHTLLLATEQSVPVFNASETYLKRIPRCLVDNMLNPKAGLARFGSATVMLRTFIRPNVQHFSVHKVDYIAAESAHLKFLHTFGEEGRKVLCQAAARIRHQAQVAFGLVDESQLSVFGTDDTDESALITPKSLLAKDDESFRRSVANCPEVGYLFFLAFMNPIYGESANVPQLSELAAIFLQCEESAREAFIELVAQADEGVLLTRLIRPLQGVLTDELRGYRRVTRNVNFATKMLALCYHGVWRASRRKNLRGLAISRKEFYNETVSDMVNLVEDYDRWSQGNTQHGMSTNDDSTMMTDQEGGYSPLDLSELPPLPVSGREEGLFAFCSYSFLLTESAKFRILEYESHTTMNEESMRSMLTFGSLQVPTWNGVSHFQIPAEHAAHLQFLVLHVRRTQIVSDVYGQVAELAEKHPRALRKPLRVMFDGEDGVDEGGVQKEFFQVLMEHILSPDYGMFELDEETHFHWLRKDFLEPEMSWALIGIIFGLAAFNSILLDVQFPPVMYRKLAQALRWSQLKKAQSNAERQGELEHQHQHHRQRQRRHHRHQQQEDQTRQQRQDEDGNGASEGSGSRLEDQEHYNADLDDVKETFPSIGNSLQQLRDYEGDDVAEVFCLTFEISYQGLFGKVENVELKPNGGSIEVTSENREEFISLYIEYLINSSIERAFKPLARGFSFMVDGPFVAQLTADELETLVIGEKELDFGGLRQTAKYEGYDEKSAVIINFWQVLDEFDDNLKRLFLSFVTGTDRSPIGGLNRLGLIIQRAEGDSNRLPTSHTCFNVLLLPEYATRAKLRDRLLTAIRNSKGFGLR